MTKISKHKIAAIKRLKKWVKDEIYIKKKGVIQFL